MKKEATVADKVVQSHAAPPAFEEHTHEMKGRLDSFLGLKTQFYQDLKIAQEKLAIAKKGLTVNMKSEGNPLGLLTRPEQAYLDCLEVNERQIERLFREDEAYWNQKLCDEIYERFAKVCDEWANFREGYWNHAGSNQLWSCYGALSKHE